MISTDSGATWSELPNTGLPTRRIHAIEVDRTYATLVFLAFGLDGVRPLWRGVVGPQPFATWWNISGTSPGMSLPPVAITGLVLLDDNTIFVSNTRGVYRSTNSGVSWTTFDEGLPNSLVTDLDILRTDGNPVLFASTWGRGLYRRILAQAGEP
jgi:hypothetical protein